MYRPRHPFPTLQAFGWTAYGVSTYLSILPELSTEHYTVAFAMKAIRTGAGFAFSMLLHRAYRAVLARGGSYRLGALIALPASAVCGAAWLTLYRVATGPIRPAELSLGGWATAPRASLDYAFVLLAWSAAYLAVRAWRDGREQERRAATATERAHAAELRMLRYQLDPHFLFNALNSLRASIPANARVARGLVDALASFLRHTLQASTRSLTPLAEEIRSVESYLAIERVRFGDRLETDVRTDPLARELPVPSFLLQPLVENAVKHGMASGARPLRIGVHGTVDEAGLRIEVVNDVGDRRPQGAGAGLGLGLDNVRDRLALAFGDRASLTVRRENGRFRGVVRIRHDRERVDA